MALILTSLYCSVTIRMVMVPVQYPMQINILKFLSVAIHWMFVILWYMIYHINKYHIVLYHYLLNRLIRRRSKKISKLRVTDICAGNFPHKWPVTRKMMTWWRHHDYKYFVVISNICQYIMTSHCLPTLGSQAEDEWMYVHTRGAGDLWHRRSGQNATSITFRKRI